jgi:hypothetical protein
MLHTDTELMAGTAEPRPKSGIGLFGDLKCPGTGIVTSKGGSDG